LNYVVYDIESTKSCFLIVLRDFQSKKQVTYKISKFRNDYDLFVSHWKSLSSRNYYFVGFNNLDFDAQVIEFILKKPRTANEIYIETQRLINTPDDEKFGSIIPEWKLTSKQIDVYKVLHYDNSARKSSLKWLEYSMRMKDIEEMPLAHDIEYTLEQENLTEEYCVNDSDATELIFSKILDELDLRFSVSEDIKIPCINYNNGKIGMEILLTKYCESTGYDKREVKARTRENLRTINIGELIYPYIKFNTPEFNKVLERFKSEKWSADKESNEKKKKDKGLFTLNYKLSRGDSAFIYGYGGLHQCIKPGVYTVESDEIIMDADVSSLYPSIPITYYLWLLTQPAEFRIEAFKQINSPVIFPPHLGLEILQTYKEKIVDVRLAEKSKPKGEQSSVIVKGYKEAANIPYGKSGEETSWFYSKRYNLTTTINGQLLISMLSEALYSIPNVTMLQNNTRFLVL